MTGWQPFREPLRTTVTRTFAIAAIGATAVAPWAGGMQRWPVLFALMLWPAYGGHWVEIVFLNRLRPRLPVTPSIHRLTRLLVWFAGGIVLALGARLTAYLLIGRPLVGWLPWAVAGILFVVIELVAHAGLHVRGRPSFYDGVG